MVLLINSFLHLIYLIVGAWASLFIRPLFWLVVLLVFFQYRRLSRFERQILGKESSVGKKTFFATLYGSLGGLGGSFLMVFAGISLSTVGIGYLWLVALLLMLIHPRFLCFSYAGGLISLSSLLFGFPKVDVSQLMGLVAVLHLVESFLILLNGHSEALPLSVRYVDGRVVGAFSLQKLWPIPVVALALIPYEFAPPGELFAMPNWWPLVKPAAFLEAKPEDFFYTLLPVLAGLGYSDLVLTSFPEAKSKQAAAQLATYSLLLLGIAILASYFPFLAVGAALFGPLGHEYVIKLGQQSERQKPPLFVAPERGVMILEVLPGSPAAKLGLARGDILLTVNKVKLSSSLDLPSALGQPGEYLEIEYLDRQKNYHRLHQSQRVEELGIVPVPEKDGFPQACFRESNLFSIFRRLLEKIGSGKKPL